MFDLDRAEKLLSRLPVRDKLTQKLIPFVLNPSQIKVHQALKAQHEKGRAMRCVVLKARRQGISTYFDSIMSVRGLARPGTNSLIVTHDFRSSKELFKTPRGILEEALGTERSLKEQLSLPKMTQHKITFPHSEGDSFLAIATAGNVEGGRGMSLTDLHCSEAAFYPGEGTFAALLPTVPNAVDTMIGIETTANGRVGVGQSFFDFWQSSVRGDTDFTAIFLSWLIDPTCVDFDHPVEDAPRDDDEKLLMKEGINIDGRLVRATLPQIAWRRMTIDSPACRGYVEVFDQEFPACVTAETLVSTEHGIIPIYQANQATLSESGPIHKWGPQPPSKIFRLTTKQGRVLRGTWDHPVAVPDGFSNLSQLQPGQIIELRAPRFAEELYIEEWHVFPGITTTLQIDSMWARFLGYFMGDGCWYEGCISIACDAKDQDVVEDAGIVVRELFGQPTSRVHETVKGRKGCVELRLGIRSCLDAFVRLGIVDPKKDGRYTRTICVPRSIMRSPRHIVREFLRALFECDGSASRNKVRFGSSKLPFLRDVQLLLLGFGINSRILGNPKVSGSGKRFEFYELGLNVAASRLFHERIGFIGKRKSSLIPLENDIGRPSKNVLKDEVLQVVAEDSEITFDFTIADEHVFSANGILTHNTPEVAFMSTGEPAFTKEEMRIARNTVQPFTGYTGSWPKRVEIASEVSHGSTIEASHIYCRDNSVSPVFIWEPPLKDHRYYFGADAARGKDEGDFAAIVGVDGETGHQVLRYAQRVDPEYLARLLHYIGSYFNKGMLCIELTGNLGLWCQMRLRDYFHYPNLYKWRGARDDKIAPHYTSSKRGGTYGWETTYRSRERLLITYRESILHRMITIRDEEVIRQMDVATRKDSWQRWEIAFGHDDVLMATMLANIARQEWHPRAVEGATSRVTTDAEQDSRILSRLNAQTTFEHLGSVTAATYKQMLKDRSKYDNDKRRGYV